MGLVLGVFRRMFGVVIAVRSEDWTHEANAFFDAWWLESWLLKNLGNNMVTID
jgi:hypothetical protein